MYTCVQASRANARASKIVVAHAANDAATQGCLSHHHAPTLAIGGATSTFPPIYANPDHWTPKDKEKKENAAECIYSADQDKKERRVQLLGINPQSV